MGCAAAAEARAREAERHLHLVERGTMVGEAPGGEGGGEPHYGGVWRGSRRAEERAERAEAHAIAAVQEMKQVAERVRIAEMRALAAEARADDYEAAWASEGIPGKELFRGHEVDYPLPWEPHGVATQASGDSRLSQRFNLRRR